MISVAMAHELLKWFLTATQIQSTYRSPLLENVMSLIAAARFETFEQAQNAANALMNNGVTSGDLHTFYVSPPGEHGTLPTGADQLSDAESTEAVKGAFGGAAALGVAGAVIGAMIGFSLGSSLLPVAIGAGIGAYLGSLLGGLSVLGRKESIDLSAAPKASHPPVRSSGVLLAVRVDALQLRLVSELLRQHGGIEVERAQGRWEAGKWQDFNPLADQDIQDPELSRTELNPTPHK